MYNDIMKKLIYVNLKDLADFNKIDKDLLTDFLLEKKFIFLKDKKVYPTEKGRNQGIHVAKGKYGEFLLYNKNMELYGLTKYRKYGTDNKKTVGNNYESFVGQYFEDKNYIVKYNGFENGMQDNSIDLIAINKREILLIQCKNWSLDWVKKNNKYIDHKDIKSFIGDSMDFIEKRPIYKEWIIKRLFIVSNPIFSKDAIAYIQNNKNIDYLILPNKNISFSL